MWNNEKDNPLKPVSLSEHKDRWAVCLYNRKTHLYPAPGLTEARLSAIQACEYRLKSSADNMQVSVLLKWNVWMPDSQRKWGVVM